MVSLCPWAPQCQPWPGPGPSALMGREERNEPGDDPAVIGAGRDAFRPRVLAEPCPWAAQGVTGRASPQWDPVRKSHLLDWVSPALLRAPGNGHRSRWGCAGGCGTEGREGRSCFSPALLQVPKSPAAALHKGWRPPRAPCPPRLGQGTAAGSKDTTWIFIFFIHVNTINLPGCSFPDNRIHYDGNILRRTAA